MKSSYLPTQTSSPCLSWPNSLSSIHRSGGSSYSYATTYGRKKHPVLESSSQVIEQPLKTVSVSPDLSQKQRLPQAA